MEEGLQVCKKLRLPADDATLEAFQAVQSSLAAMLKEDAAACAAAKGEGKAAGGDA